ncbi:formyl peptide receptor-like 1 inhibitory protein [Staphylococcus aureus]|nr:formyl peptide receptor-like 1 inhibitory protein [Staphylococcus aureus]
MKKHIVKSLFASVIVGSGLFAYTNPEAKAYFEIEQPWWHEEVKDEKPKEDKSYQLSPEEDTKASKIIEEFNQSPDAHSFKAETVEDLYLVAKKLEGKQKTAVVRTNNNKDYYTFDLTKPLQEHRKNIKITGGYISSINWH